jgi:hypothetical protein
MVYEKECAECGKAFYCMNECNGDYAKNRKECFCRECILNDKGLTKMYSNPEKGYHKCRQFTGEKAFVFR